MALTATVFKADLQIADMDRGYYADHHLTLARHPSETDERMMVRLLAFALHASEALQFTKGVCADDEPQLWERSLSDEPLLWIEVGLPDERRLRKACNRARQRATLSVATNRMSTATISAAPRASSRKTAEADSGSCVPVDSLGTCG